jgi:hypothetical protein
MGLLDRMMGKSEAGAGRGFVNPKTIAEMEDEKRSPAEREARQMMKDRAAAKAAEAAYNRSVTSEGMAKGGKVSSASRRADGIATKGKTKGTMIAMCGGGMMKRK